MPSNSDLKASLGAAARKAAGGITRAQAGAPPPGGPQGVFDLNGTPVSSINTDGSIEAGSGLTMSALPPNCYGNRAVARRLVDSLTPAKKVTLLHLGDSRNDLTDGLDYCVQYGWGIPWGGTSLALAQIAAGGPPWTHSLTNASAVPVAAPAPIGGGYIGAVSAKNLYALTMTGTTVIPWANNRMFEQSYNSAVMLPMQPQVDGRALTWRWPVMRGPFGMSQPEIQKYIRSSATTPIYSSYISTYAAALQLSVETVVAPNTWDWTTAPLMTAGALYDGAPTVGEILYCEGLTTLESDIGVTHYNLAVFGRRFSSYTNTDILGNAVLQRIKDNASGEVMLWLSLGTNGSTPGAAGVDAMVVEAQATIARMRSFWPNCMVLIDTAFYTSAQFNSVSRSIRLAAKVLADIDPLVLMIDTSVELGSFASMSAAGYFGAAGGDGVHFAAAGFPYYFGAVGDMVARCAG